MSSWFAAPTGNWFDTPAEQQTVARDRQTVLGMPDTCTVVAWLTTQNRRGQTVNRREIVRATDVPCRLERDLRLVLGAESGGAYGRTGEVIDTSALAFRVALPWGTDVRESDHLVLPDDTHLEVGSVDDLSSYGVEVYASSVRVGIDQPGAGEET